jgi:hypothetical protein
MSASMPVKSKPACQPRFDFRDQRAIVTGGSRGIGRAIADAGLCLRCRRAGAYRKLPA